MAGGNVPGNLAPIFSAAGKAFGIPPAVLAGIASVESNIGQNTGPSSAGAVGLMQFLPSTARGLGVNPNDPRSAIFGTAKYLSQLGFHQNPQRAIGAYNGGPGNPQMGYARQVLSEARRLAPQLGGRGGGALASSGLGGGVGAPGMVPVTTQGFDQAAFDAAKARFIAGSAVKQADSSSNPFGATPGASSGFAKGLGPDSGALFANGLLSTAAPNPASYVTEQTTMRQAAVHGLQQLAGTGLVNVHGGAAGDVNPIPGAVIGRTDMGVDANLKPGAPIRAPNDVKVVAVVPGWYSGQPYVAVQILKGPNAGKAMYVAEQISGVPPVGSVIRRGQPITRFAARGTGIEIGWANPRNPSQTLAQAQGRTGDSSHGNAPAGVNFRSFLGQLGS